MSDPVFLVETLPAPGRFRLDGTEGRHAATVRRLRIGERLLLTDGAGGAVFGTVVSVGKNELELEVGPSTYSAELRPRLVVVQALPKGDRGELAVAQLTEAGVDEILPWQAARCVTRWEGARGEKSRQRWWSAMREAAKQSRRLWLPVLGPAPRPLTGSAPGSVSGPGPLTGSAPGSVSGPGPLTGSAPGSESGPAAERSAGISGTSPGSAGSAGMSAGSAGPAVGLPEVLRRIAAADLALVLHESAESPLAARQLPDEGELLLVIGPEGGISEEELEAMTAAGAHAVRLGPTVLRTSTAGVVALAVVSAATGRWS